MVLGFQLFDSTTLALVDGSGEPCVQDLLGYHLRRKSQARAEDVGIVPLPGAPGRLGIGAESRAHAGDFVGSDTYAGPRPAEQDTLVTSSSRHTLRHLPGYLRPGVRVPGERANKLHLAPAGLEVCRRSIGGVCPLVAANRHAHFTPPEDDRPLSSLPSATVKMIRVLLRSVRQNMLSVYEVTRLQEGAA